MASRATTNVAKVPARCRAIASSVAPAVLHPFPAPAQPPGRCQGGSAFAISPAIGELPVVEHGSSLPTQPDACVRHTPRSVLNSDSSVRAVAWGKLGRPAGRRVPPLECKTGWSGRSRPWPCAAPSVAVRFPFVLELAGGDAPSRMTVGAADVVLEVLASNPPQAAATHLDGPQLSGPDQSPG
jgi:hypothetical protein